VSKIVEHIKNINGSYSVAENLSLQPKDPNSKAVGIVSELVLLENINRSGLILINVSSNRISFGFGTDAILDKGITLYPGGVFNMAECDFYSGNIYGIAADINSVVTIQEFVRAG
jgi:hypothetical protein